MDNCNCPDREPDPHAKHSAWRQISMDCPIHGEPTQDQLAARIRELEAENKALRKGQGVKVKPLGWDESGDDKWAQSRTGAGWEYLARNMGEYWVMPFPWKPPERFATLESAKAAAQADYERRILSALSPAPVSAGEAARVLLADDDALTDLAIQTMRNNNPAEGVHPGYIPALTAALRALSEGEGD